MGDVSRTWYFILNIFYIFMSTAQAQRSTIMLSPAGDSQNAGRQLADGFERGITRQLAEIIKEQLEEDTCFRVIMTHGVGEQINQEQKATFANTMSVDLYIALGAYGAQNLCIDYYFYQTIQNPTPSTTRLFFCPAKQAGMSGLKKNINTIQAQFHTQFKINPLIGAPLIVLQAIKTPAYYIEVGVPNGTNIQALIPPLKASIQELLP